MFFLFAVALNVASFTVRRSSVWADTFFFFAFGVGVSVGSAGVSILPGGDWEGRYLNLPSAMIPAGGFSV